MLRLEGLGEQKEKRLSMAEPIAIIVLFTTLGMLLPLFFPCTPTQCIVQKGDAPMHCPTPHVQ